MFRSLAAATALATLALAGAVSAQTYGQPVYLNAYGRPVGGTPLSEVETRSYVETGRWADGYSDRPRIYVPAPGYGRPYTRHGSGYRSYGHGSDHGHGYGGGRYDAPPRPGYRDAWGYDDDRPPSTWRGSYDQDTR
ncbi:MAG: hypothetical protein PSV23_14920 [Brevundimonas sp.]|uniref:hypothetical protein n=1 Tax=Brevundimonas sp. TaxID=1871086 RepID=UPI00248A0A47|nr:hypothetical protein [Brevundimonas sp.]MDI1328082.1 hypothetical protein [Brevundimonas sp.]